uniref:Uncharacterized protein n=1 Tax=Arundo donax TaxID=35708 RepID=A0A0A9BCU0_ARUDO
MLICINYMLFVFTIMQINMKYQTSIDMSVCKYSSAGYLTNIK